MENIYTKTVKLPKCMIHQKLWNQQWINQIGPQIENMG